MRSSRLPLAAALVAFAVPALAQGLSPDDVAAVEAAIDAEMTGGNLPGVAIGVWLPGADPYLAAMGMANLDTGAPRAPQDPFRSGSVTKTVIGTMILQLADEGALSLDAPIATWFPNFPNANRITVDDLLRMRSGIWDSWTDAELVAYYADPLHPPSMETMIARAAAEAARFAPPDDATVYANLNFLLLDRIVAAVTGTETAAAAEARVFAPLGMSQSALPSDPDLPGPLRGYGWNATAGAFEDKTRVDVRPVGGAGSMVSTLADLDKLVRAVCTGSLVTPETQAGRLRTEAFEGAPDIVRYGEAVATLGPFCGHNGTIMGFSTEAWYLPSRDATIVINVNRLDADDASTSSALFAKIAKTLFPDDVPW